MGQVLLGLDIGTTSIKGVRLAKGFRGLRMLDSFEEIVEQREGPSSGTDPLLEGQITALQTLIAEEKIQSGDLIALSLPGDLLITREITVPFADPKKLQQIVPFEIEGELPFDLEAVTVDYMALQKATPSSPNSQETALLVSAVPNETVSRYLDALRPIGIDPAWIGSNELTLYTFAKYFLGVQPRKSLDEEQTELLVIDVGAARTTLCYIQDGTLGWVRTIPIGGDDFTEAIKLEFDLTWEEADAWKLAIGAGDAAQTAYEEKGPEILETGIERLITEIDKTLRTYQTKSGQAASGTEEEGGRRMFHLCGGGASLSRLQDLLANVLEMEPVMVDVGPQSRIASVDGMDAVEADFVSHVYAQALGLALQESDGPPINFRQGEFVYGKESIERRHQLTSIGLAGLLILGLMGGDLALHYQKKENRYQALKAQLRSTYVQAFPKTRNVVNEVEQTRAAITELKQTGGFFRLGETSPLVVLTAITQAIPEKIKIDVFDIVIDGSKVRIQAQTDSFESVDQIRGGLLKAAQFTEVEVSDAKVMADQSRVRFRIKMTVADRRKRGENRPS